MRNFQSSLRKELFDHKLHVADQQRKNEKEKEEVKPKTSVGVLESDDEGMNRKTVVEVLIIINNYYSFHYYYFFWLYYSFVYFVI